MKRKGAVCWQSGCIRFKRQGILPEDMTNYICLYADVDKSKTLEVFEDRDVPNSCPFRERHRR